MRDSINKETKFTVRLNSVELSKLNELTKSQNQSKSDVLRSLIMNSNSNDNLSMEILQRIYTLLQIVLGSMKQILPEYVTQEWITGIISDAKKRYPTD